MSAGRILPALPFHVGRADYLEGTVRDGDFWVDAAIAEPGAELSEAGGSIMRGHLEKRVGPAPFRSTVLAFLLVGGLLLLMLLCGWLYAGTSGAVIATILGAIALMLVRKVSPQFFLLMSGARSIDPEDMPALFGIIGALCRRAGIGQVPSLYFLPSGVPTAFAPALAISPSSWSAQGCCAFS